MRASKRWMSVLAAIALIALPSSFAFGCGDRDDGAFEELKDEADEAREEIEDEIDDQF